MPTMQMMVDECIINPDLTNGFDDGKRSEDLQSRALLVIF